MFNEVLTIWSDHAGLSASIWLVLLVFAAYLARNPAHALLDSTGRSIHGACRLFSAALRNLEKNLHRAQ